jgi:undecaprenyl diphosphate synthase
MASLKDIDRKKVPRHIAVIMDGNGRWAQQKGLSRSEGHIAGAQVIESLMDSALELGIECISLYAFSTENWSRPPMEIKGLWKLFEYYFDKKMPVIAAKGIRIRHSGVYDRLPSGIVKRIEKSLADTARNRRMTLNFCLNYGSRREITDAVNRCLEKGVRKITEKDIARNLYNPDLPEVDLLIRTSGEERISNFLLWQAAYAEIVFSKVLWPDFKPRHLFGAIAEYQKRNRRFGGL